MLDLDYKEVAERYGGNKQKIAQAAALGALGPEGPLLAVTAGMYIDRMRAAQMAEQVPQQTVAQQVLAPQPQMAPQGMAGMPPQGAPQGAPQGLTAMMPPEMTQQMPPEGEQPMPEEGMVPEGMAAGGLAGLPVPDAMFDEPGNGGYGDDFASGGLVAFAGGGSLGPWFEEQAVKAIPGVGVTSRRRSLADNQRVGGTAKSYHLTDDARDFVPPPGSSMSQLHSQLKGLYGAGFDVINEGDHIHVEPGPGKSKGLASTSAAQRASVSTTTRSKGDTGSNMDLTQLIDPTMEQGLDLYDKYMPEPKTEALSRLTEEAEDTLDPETQKKRVKDDMWATLAEIGFNMASSNTPYFLQAVGAAASAALPGAREDKKARQQEKKEAIRTLAEVEDISNKQAEKRVNFAREHLKEVLNLKDRELNRGLDIWKTETTEAGAMERARIAAAASMYGDDTRVAAARVAAQAGGGSDQFSRTVAMQYGVLRDQARAGIPITTPDGKEVVVRDRAGNVVPINRIADSELREIALKWASHTLGKTDNPTEGAYGLPNGTQPTQTAPTPAAAPSGYRVIGVRNP